MTALNLQQLAREIATGTGAILLFVAALGVPAVLVRRHTRIGDELFRKLLHLIAVTAFMIWPFVFEHWYAATLTALAFIAILYPTLAFLERLSAFSRFVNERNVGEFKTSMVLVLVMFLVVVSVCWGCRKERMLAVAAIAAWGFGDATAALVGKRFGRHAIEGRFVDGRKSLEGSAAMLVVSFLCVLVVLAVRGGMTGPGLMVTSLAAALASTIAELLSKHGFDTMACPLAAMAAILPLTWLLSGVPL